MGWCGHYNTALWEHGTLAPCKTETVSGIAILIAAAIIFFAQYYRCRTIVTRRRVPVPVNSNQQLLSGSVYGLLAALHAAWLMYMALSPHANFAPFDFVFHLVLLLIWTTSLVRCC